MYIAMNRFRVAAGKEDEFERVWRERNSYLDEVPGFKEFQLLRGPDGEEETLFISHSVWENEEVFKDWTKSEAFAKAHKGARSSKGTVLSHPKFEGFKVVL